MRKVFLAFLAMVALLLADVGTAGAAMQRGVGNGFHGGHFHDGHFHDGHFHRNFVFIGAPFFWWGAPYYAYYPYYNGYYFPAPGDLGSTTYIQRDGTTAAQSSGDGYSHYCTDPTGFYPQVQNCTKGWLKVVPDGSPTPEPR